MIPAAQTVLAVLGDLGIGLAAWVGCSVLTAVLVVVISKRMKRGGANLWSLSARRSLVAEPVSDSEPFSTDVA